MSENICYTDAYLRTVAASVRGVQPADEELAQAATLKAMATVPARVRRVRMWQRSSRSDVGRGRPRRRRRV